MCRGEGGTLQTNIAGMCGAGSARSVWTTQGFLKLMGACAFRVYTAQVAGCSAGYCPKWALHFLHFPGPSCSGSGFWVHHKCQTWLHVCFVPFPGPSSSGDQGLGECTVPSGLCILITSWVRTTQFTGAPWEHQLRCVICLLWGADPKLRPSQQMSTVQDSRKRACSQFSGGCRSLGLRLPLTFWLWLSHTCLSASCWERGL